MNTYPHSRQKGKIAELYSAAYLRRKGYKLLARNYAYRGGEIDIIAQDEQGKIIFAEVKSNWKTKSEHPTYRVGRIKQYRIWRTACHYLHNHANLEAPSRFDVFFVHIKNKCPQIKHYPGAFEATSVIPSS